MMRRKISLEQNRSFYRRNDSLALFPVFLSHLVSEQRSTISRRSHGYLDGENYACRRVIDRIIAATWLKNFIDRVNCNRLRDLAQRSCFFVAAIIIELVFTFHSMTRQTPFTLTTLFVSDNTDTIRCWAILLYASLRVIVIFLWRRGY